MSILIDSLRGMIEDDIGMLENVLKPKFPKAQIRYMLADRISALSKIDAEMQCMAKEIRDLKSTLQMR